MDWGIKLESGENSDCNTETKDTECPAAAGHIHTTAGNLVSAAEPWAGIQLMNKS